MPFEPRILPNDDAGPDRDPQPSHEQRRLELDEFESPAMELLASQLSDDAAYLARLYPAGSARPDARGSRPAVARRAWMSARADLWRLAVAATVLLMLGVGGPVAVWLTQSEPEADVADRTATEIVNTNASASDASLAANDAIENPIQAETGGAGLVHTILSGELSPSEQEAVFDLLEDEPTELARVSL